MRQTKFWKENISDSIINSERTFGSILNSFQNATGVSISNGLDEFYMSNSWDGENAFVIKGAFDKTKLDDFFKKDTNYVKQDKPDGIKLYYDKKNNIYFFFKDNFTLCASNFSTQINDMISAKDTSLTGVMKNEDLVKAIQKIIYKNNLWMISTEKMFIRGILLNIVESKRKFSDSVSMYSKDSLEATDSVSTNQNKTEELLKNRLFEKINAIAFSAKMKDELELLVQSDCIDANSADYVYKLISGLVTVAKLNSAMNKSEKTTGTEKILESMKISKYETSVQISFNINSDNISAFRKSTLLTKPE
jgi:hypothetical protein